MTKEYLDAQIKSLFYETRDMVSTRDTMNTDTELYREYDLKVDNLLSHLLYLKQHPNYELDKN